MQTQIGHIFYDTITNIVTYYILNGTFVPIDTRIDFTNALLHNVGTDNVTIYGTNITYNGSLISGYYYTPPPAVVVPPNATQDNTTIEAEFYYDLNYT